MTVAVGRLIDAQVLVNGLTCDLRCPSTVGPNSGVNDQSPSSASATVVATADPSGVGGYGSVRSHVSLA